MIAQWSPKTDVQEYIDGVLSGEIVAGKMVRMAVERHVHDLAKSYKRGLKFDTAKAVRACRFFPNVLRHSIGEWDKKPFYLSKWQAFVVWNLWGWRWIDSGLRRFRKALISVARKNGKTVMLAGVANLMHFADDPPEPGAEIYSVATKEDQAKLMFREAERQVRASPALFKRALIRKSPASIQWVSNNSFYKPLGSDSNSTDGLNPHGVLMDELHEWRETHRALKEKLSSGSGARRQPLELMITTAGSDKSQLWIEEDDYARQVLEGSAAGNIIDDTYFAYVARLDDEDDPLDETMWPKANPNYGISVKPEYLRNQANEARHKPTAMNQFVRYHANRRVASSERLISVAAWEKGNAPLTITESMVGYGGIDIGRSNDWCAIAACFPIHGENGEVARYEVTTKAWCCKDGRFPVANEPYRSWIRRGLLTMHPGNSVDFAEVVREVKEWSKTYDIGAWAFDPNFAKIIGQQLVDEGIPVYEFNQSAKKYNEPIRTFVKELDNGRIIHGGDEVLSWQAGNLQVVQNSRGEWMPDKSNRESKIDGMVAALMAFSECLFAEKKSQGDLYVV